MKKYSLLDVKSSSRNHNRLSNKENVTQKTSINTRSYWELMHKNNSLVLPDADKPPHQSKQHLISYNPPSKRSSSKHRRES